MSDNLLAYVPDENAFQNKTILVTGAGSGLGRALSIAYARFGATVILLDKKVPWLEAVFDDIVTAGYPEPAIYPLDLQGANQDDYQTMAENIQQQLGGLEGMVLNAASLAGFMPLAQQELKTWLDTLTANLHANFMLIQACLPMLQQSGSPSIVFSTDNTSKAYYGAYGVSKAGLNALCDILAQEYENPKHFMRVNRIHTGPMRTEMRRIHFPGEVRSNVVRPEALLGPYLFYMSADAGRRTGEALELGRVAADYRWPGEIDAG